MSNESDKKISKICDDRLIGYTKRTRSGREQVFYTGNDERDFPRYNADGGGRKHNVTMHDKPDTIRIQPPEKHIYAELIDGEWWWVNGCGPCNGEDRGHKTYIECLEHDVCRTCHRHRSEFKDSVWGGRNGWQCRPCQEVEHEEEKREALDAMPEEFDDSDFHYMNEITCPYCAYEFSDSWEHSEDDSEDHDCPRCENVFEVTAEISVTFNCDRKG